MPYVLHKYVKSQSGDLRGNPDPVLAVIGCKRLLAVGGSVRENRAIDFRSLEVSDAGIETRPKPSYLRYAAGGDRARRGSPQRATESGTTGSGQFPPASRTGDRGL